MVYEDFFVAGLHMPLHLALADILLHFQAQLHQLTPNAITQLSKYFWVVGSFGGVPSGGAFAKWSPLFLMGVPYAPYPLPGSVASQVAIKKRKVEVSKRSAVKKANVGPSQAVPSKVVPPPPKLGPAMKIGVMNIARPKAKPGP
jgi:hypothetical protein